jgi:hypothetical protein
MTRKQIMLCALMAGVSTLGIVGLASAATGTKPASLAAEIASKFHLNQSEVQAVIDQHHGEMRAYHEDNYEERLSQAVKDGKITEDQKKALLAKHDELMKFMDSLQDKTPAERRDAMKAKLDELHKWAEDNHIPPRFLMGPGMGMGMRHFGGGHMMHVDEPSDQ